MAVGVARYGGNVVGNTLNLTWVYDTGVEGVPGVTHNMTGTIAPDGSISGTWNDNYHGVTRTGTFTATGAAVVDYSGKRTGLTRTRTPLDTS